MILISCLSHKLGDPRANENRGIPHLVPDSTLDPRTLPKQRETLEDLYRVLDIPGARVTAVLAGRCWEPNSTPLKELSETLSSTCWFNLCYSQINIHFYFTVRIR